MADKEGYYDALKEMRDFIDNLPELDSPLSLLPAVRKHNKVPMQNVTSEFIDEMIEHWVQSFGHRHADEGKKEFVIDVFNRLRTINIPEEWFPYVKSLVEWLRLSAPDRMYGNLAIFLFGYLWRMNIEEEPLD